MSRGGCLLFGPYASRRFRGVRTVYPSPVTGRSASFRLRFRFVRVVRTVRAGEAKLRGVGLGGVALG